MEFKKHYEWKHNENNEEFQREPLLKIQELCENSSDVEAWWILENG